MRKSGEYYFIYYLMGSCFLRIISSFFWGEEGRREKREIEKSTKIEKFIVKILKLKEPTLDVVL
jgi:hypothetical protein